MLFVALFMLFQVVKILSPLAIIFAINTLFGTHIPYDLMSWLCMSLICIALKILTKSKVEIINANHLGTMSIVDIKKKLEEAVDRSKGNEK